MKIIGSVSVIADPSNATKFVIEPRREAVDKRRKPPAVFHQLRERVFAVNGAIKNFAVSAEDVTENRHEILSHKRPSLRKNKKNPPDKTPDGFH